jgi:hypothetical protein
MLKYEHAVFPLKYNKPEKCENLFFNFHTFQNLNIDAYFKIAFGTVNLRKVRKIALDHCTIIFLSLFI